MKRLVMMGAVLLAAFAWTGSAHAQFCQYEFSNPENEFDPRGGLLLFTSNYYYDLLSPGPGDLKSVKGPAIYVLSPRSDGCFTLFYSLEQMNGALTVKPFNKVDASFAQYMSSDNGGGDAPGTLCRQRIETNGPFCEFDLRQTFTVAMLKQSARPPGDLYSATQLEIQTRLRLLNNSVEFFGTPMGSQTPRGNFSGGICGDACSFCLSDPSCFIFGF